MNVQKVFVSISFQLFLNLSKIGISGPNIIVNLESEKYFVKLFHIRGACRLKIALVYLAFVPKVHKTHLNYHCWRLLYQIRKLELY